MSQIPYKKEMKEAEVKQFPVHETPVYLNQLQVSGFQSDHVYKDEAKDIMEKGHSQYPFTPEMTRVEGAEKLKSEVTSFGRL